MPCYVTGSAQGDAELDARECSEELEVVTRVACELAKFASNYKRAFSAETEKWMAKHDALDRRREADERREREEEGCRKRALKKLSLSERKALGLR